MAKCARSPELKEQQQEEEQKQQLCKSIKLKILISNQGRNVWESSIKPQPVLVL